MLAYKNVYSVVAIGSKTGTTRTSVALTTSFGDASTTKDLFIKGASKINLDILYTMGATETSNFIDVRFEASPDGTNYYRIANDDTSAGTSTLTARDFKFVGADAAAATISIPLDVFYQYIRVSVKESGVVTNAGTVYAEMTVAGR